MKILTKNNKNYISKRLIALQNIIINWDQNDPKLLAEAIDNIADIAFAISGMGFMVDIEDKVRLERRK